MKIRIANKVVFDSIVDGIGLRAVIFTQGCNHKCKGCHNPQTWNFDGGIEEDTNNIVREILNNPLNKGITFSGGEPLEQASACLDILLGLKEQGYNDFWAYTGYNWENILKDEDKMKFVKELNVLVDGKFDINKKSYDLMFKGSSNQRVIDVQKSLENNSVVCIEYY